VRDALLFGPRRPRIEMGVEMDDRHGPIDFIQRTQDGENDGVISAEAVVSGWGGKRRQGLKGTADGIRDDFGVLLVVLCEWPRRADLSYTVRVRDFALQESRVCNFHLVERQLVVEWADWDLDATTNTSFSVRKHTKKKEQIYVCVQPTGGSDTHIPAIDDFKALLIGIKSPGQRPCTIAGASDTATTDANARGPKARARSVRHRSVEGHPKQRDVKRGRDVFEAADVGEVGKGEGAREWEVVLLAVLLAPGLGGIAMRRRVVARVCERGLLVRTGAQNLQMYGDENDD